MIQIEHNSSRRLSYNFTELLPDTETKQEGSPSIRSENPINDLCSDIETETQDEKGSEFVLNPKPLVEEVPGHLVESEIEEEEMTIKQPLLFDIETLMLSPETQEPANEKTRQFCSLFKYLSLKYRAERDIHGTTYEIKPDVQDLLGRAICDTSIKLYKGFEIIPEL